MNKITQHQNKLPTRFTLKPLLIAIPLSVLAACANNQENSYPNEQTISYSEEPAPYSATLHTSAPVDSENIDQPVDATAHQQTDIGGDDGYADASGPDLTDQDATSETETAAHALLQKAETSEENTSQDVPNNNTTEGSDTMAVLVIENPEILPQLTNNTLKPVIPHNQRTLAESMHRPGKRVFHFGFNQTSLSEEDIELIEKHADYLKANPDLQITVHGHTDAQGNPDYNLTLSQQRAAMVVSQLKKHGISESRIKTIGWGGGYPLVSSLNFAENRRIEIEYSEIHFAANQ